MRDCDRAVTLALKLDLLILGLNFEKVRRRGAFQERRGRSLSKQDYGRVHPMTRV